MTPEGGTAGAPARNARQEAKTLVGGAWDVRVLEPSPPAVASPWFADDPLDLADARGRVIAPIHGADQTWDAWVATRPEQAPWVAARWLGAYQRLPATPDGLAQTRLALHRLSAYVMSPARRRVNGKIGLRWTYRGFGTPFFGDDEQVRVQGDQLVKQVGATTDAAPITTLDAAAAFVLNGLPDLDWAEPFDIPAAGDLDETLPVDRAAAEFLGEWFGYAWSVLEAVRADDATCDPSRVQLWPEHFDAAFEALPDTHRTMFGASPGDAAHPQPYLYVLPPPQVRRESNGVWNADAFPGAILPWPDVVDAADQRAAALAFFRRCRDAVTGG